MDGSCLPINRSRSAQDLLARVFEEQKIGLAAESFHLIIDGLRQLTIVPGLFRGNGRAGIFFVHS